MSSGEPQVDERSGIPLLQRKAVRVGSVHFRKEKALETLLSFPIPKEGYKEAVEELFERDRE